MFSRKSKKKAPAPVVPPPQQSRADSYIIGAPPDFTSQQDFYKDSFLKPSSTSTSERSNPESTSLSSVASSSTSEDASGQSGKSKTGGSLTFSTFLGTPQMQRKNGVEEDTGKFAKPPKPDKKLNSASTEDDSSSGKGKDKKGKKQDGTGQKKQSVISKMKQALTTPRLGRKAVKDVPGTPPGGRSGTKPPPPPPKRTSSLTRDDERRKFGQIDITDTSELQFVNISDFDEEPKPSIETPANRDPLLANIKIPGLANEHLQGTANAIGTSNDLKTLQSTESQDQSSEVPVDEEAKTLSLEIGSIDVGLSDRPEEVDSERCDDTLQSVDYISDDEASESISSNSVSNAVSNSVSNSVNNLVSNSHRGLLTTFSQPTEPDKLPPDLSPSANITYDVQAERTSGSLSNTQSDICDNALLPGDGVREHSSADETSVIDHTDSGKSISSCDMSQNRGELWRNNKSSQSFETTVWDSPCNDRDNSISQRPTSSFYTGTFITDLKGLRNSQGGAMSSTFLTDGLESEDLSEGIYNESSSPDRNGSPKLSTFGQPTRPQHSPKSPKFKKSEQESSLTQHYPDSDGPVLSEHRSSAGEQTETVSGASVNVLGISRITALNESTTQEAHDNVIDLTVSLEAPLSPVAPPRRKRTATPQSTTPRTPDSMSESDIQCSLTSPMAASKSLNMQNSQVSNTTPIGEGGNSAKEKRLSSPKPPVGPKPQWIKDKVNSPGSSMEEATPKAAGRVDRSPNELETVGKAPQTSPSKRSSNSRTLTRQSAQQHHSDTDSVSSSGYESKSPGKGQSPKDRPTAQQQQAKWRKATADEDSTTTDDDIAMLSATESSSSELLMVNRSMTSGRTATPTLELYHNAWDIGPESRCLPSPRPDDQSCVLVESDDQDMDPSPSRVWEKDNMAILQAPKVVMRKGSPHITQLSKSMQLGLYSNMDYNIHGELSPYPTRTPYNTPHAVQPPIHYTRSVDTDMEIAESFLSPRLKTKTQSVGSLMHRSSTPNIDHIRHLQNDRSFSNDIVVDNLKYRPSTPLIGGHSLDLSDAKSRPMITKDLLRTRMSTPVLGVNTIRDYNDEVLSPRRQPLIAKRPQSSLDYYGNTVPEDNGLGQEQAGYNLNYDQWRNLPQGAGPAQQRRPPSPVLRAKVNSVLDSLMSKPIGRGRSPHTRSVSADHLLNGQNLLKLPEPRLNESYNANIDLNSSLQGSYLNPTIHRPPSPFNRFSPRPGYHDQSDIDVEFDFQGAVLKGCNDVVTPRHVPPLNLDFTRQRSEESMLSPARTDAFDHIPVCLHSGTPSSVQAESALRLDNYFQSIPPSNSSNSDVRHSFPGYKEREASAGSRQAVQGPAQREVSVEGADDDTPEISSACLELSTPVTSDSECEADLTTRGGVQWGWQVKTAESWSSKDVTEWCSANGFHQTAAALRERGLTGQDLMVIGDEHLVELGVQEEAEREFFMSELHKLRLKPKSAASLWRLKQTSMKRRTLEASSELLKERLYNLQQLSSDQNQRIDTSMEELIKHQQQTDQLLSRSNSDYNGEQLPPHHNHNDGGIAGVQMDVPLIKWTPEDVETWLKASGLEKFAPTFQAHHVRGRDLAGISLQFLDELSIHATNDRELLLSKLYDLQRPTLEDMNSPPITHEPMVSMEVTSTDLYSINNGSQFSTPSKNSSLQSKLKDMVSPRKFGGKQEEKTIRISHDVLGSAGCTDVKISEATTSVEAVQKVLEELELTDDINLFYLSRGETELGKFECPLSVARQAPGGGTRFELHKRLGITIKAICHLSAMKPRGKGFRVSPFSTSPELLQVALRKFRMSHVDPSLFCLLPVNKETGDVRLMAESEMVQDCETDTFMLTHQENVDHLLTRTDDTLPLLEQNKQILRRNSSLNSHGSSALSQSSEASQGSDSGKPRFEQLESLEARMADIEASLASNLLEVDHEDSGSPDRLPPSARHGRIPPSGRRKNYNQPEAKAQPPPTNQISRYITPKKQKLPSSNSFGIQDIQPDDNLELMREIALMRESVQERDAAISTLRHQNDLLQTQSKQVEELRTQLSEVTLRQQEQEQNMREQLQTAHQTLEVKHRQLEHANQALQVEQRRRGTPEDDDSDSGRETNRSTRDSTPGSTSDLSNDLEQQERELHSVQNEARTLEDELADLRSRRQRALQDSRVSGDTINVQLLGEDCSIAEAKLLRVKQRHADLYARLELTKKEHEKAQKEKAGPCLYDTLSPGPPQGIVCVELSSSDGPGFIPGRDKQDRVIVKHLAEGLPLSKGDRLLEVNGQRVFHLEDQALHQILREVRTPVKLVVIRDIEEQSSRGADTSEEMAAMKEDLSLAMMEVESLQQDNQDLTNEVEKLKTNNQRLKGDNKELRQELQVVRRKMDELSQQNHETHTNNNTELPKSPNMAAMEQTTFTRREESAKKKLRFGDDFQTEVPEPGTTHLTNGALRQPEEEGGAAGAKGPRDGDESAEVLPRQAHGRGH